MFRNKVATHITVPERALIKVRKTRTAETTRHAEGVRVFLKKVSLER